MLCLFRQDSALTKPSTTSVTDCDSWWNRGKAERGYGALYSTYRHVVEHARGHHSADRRGSWVEIVKRGRKEISNAMSVHESEIIAWALQQTAIIQCRLCEPSNAIFTSTCCWMF